MLACICGGILEVGIVGAAYGVGAIVTIVTTLWARWYNRRNCAGRCCLHNPENQQ